MNSYQVFNKVGRSGEYILGKEVTGTHACYMIYGILAPGESGRTLSPGPGHEELILVLQGTATLTGHVSIELAAGQAIHLCGEESCLAANKGEDEMIYIIAGGHSGQGHH